ncbi:cyclin-dependent kinase 11B isoform X2 [Nasonia vitripennis]|uniref:cyclin-dependent kinase n=1 Tax=Nasonia vitripennis TaxID=7425 RepID=A0A7M7HJ43_NASVI|nr:cyclin-dependent kinase 11B isoform X2 [Nasonia vitripennis]
MPAIKKSQTSFSEEEGADTADSLEIKPPQAVVRHRKTTSHRRDKHSDRSGIGGGSGSDRSRDDKERKSRHHERGEESRHRDKHSRHRRHEMDVVVEKSRRSDPSKRDRESSRHERKERSTGDRVLEDLRESNFGRTNSSNNQSRMTSRLLDKRRERREEPPREYKMDTSSSSRSREEGRMSDGRSGERREIRVEELRERREMRIAAAAAAAAAADEATNRDQRREIRMEEQRSRHIRMTEQDMGYVDVELMEQQMAQEHVQRSSSGREKRHKRSHKHDRIRERDREREKLEKEIAHREKHAREQHQAMEVSVYEELERMEAIAAEQHMASNKDPREMTEQELRRQKLLDAEREMARRKENSRIELEARRMKRGEKRHHSPEIMPPEHAIVELSDESVRVTNIPSDDASEPKSNRSRLSDEEMRDATREQSPDNESTDSSDSSSDDDDDDDDDDDSNDSNKDSNDDSNNSDYNNPSPLSVDQLAKSDRSERSDSPGHVDTNGSAKPTNETKKDVIDIGLDLPPYFPAIQGCRSVEEYKCLNRIAEGTYGVVYRAEDRRTKEIVALKRLKMEKEKDGFPITSLREINTLLKAQHPNIVTVREIVVGSNMDKIFIVMDYVEHDLKSLMETMKSKNQVFIPGEIKCLMQQLLRAVAHLHDNWILHRDLKTSNLLLSHRGILKVGDFGLAREYGSPLKQYTSVVVTLWYRAPELLLGMKEYSTPIDMWSVGCIFAELLRMEALFPGKSEIDYLNRVFKELGTPSDRIWPGYSKLPLVKKIPFAHYPVNNIRQRFSLSLSDAGIELLAKFLTYDPAQRITADDALKHTYFTESPLPIDPAMFPTWPAKSEFGARTLNASPKPPSGGKEFKQLGENDDEDSASGFHMGSREASRQLPVGGGFHLKF